MLMYRSKGQRRRWPRSRAAGCLLWIVLLIVILIVLSVLFGGFQKGTKAAAREGTPWTFRWHQMSGCGRAGPRVERARDHPETWGCRAMMAVRAGAQACLRGSTVHERASDQAWATGGQERGTGR